MQSIEFIYKTTTCKPHTTRPSVCFAFSVARSAFLSPQRQPMVEEEKDVQPHALVASSDGNGARDPQDVLKKKASESVKALLSLPLNQIDDIVEQLSGEVKESFKAAVARSRERPNWIQREHTMVGSGDGGGKRNTETDLLCRIFFYGFFFVIVVSSEI